MSEKNEIIKNTFSYTISNYISRTIALVKNLVIAKLFSPSMFGVWKTFNLILGYNDYANLGFYEGMFREMPFKLSKVKIREAHRIRNNVFSIVLLIMLAASAIIFVSSFFLKQAFPEYIITCIRLFALLVLFDQANTFYKYIFRIRKKFTIASKVMIFMSGIDFVLVIIFLFFKAQILGLIVALIITQVSTLLFTLLRWREPELKFELNKKILKRLFRIGFFIMLTFLIWVLFRTIDQFMILLFLGAEKVGYYALGQGFSGWIYTIPSVFGLIIGSYIFTKYGQRQEKSDIEQHLIQSTKIFAYLIPIITGICYITIPVFVKFFLPNYSESIWVIKILLIGTFFVSLNHAATYYLIAVNKQKSLVKLGAISLGLVILLDFIAIKLNFGINGVAIATTVAYFIYITLLISVALKNQRYDLKNELLFFTETYFPFVYCFIMLLLLDFIIGNYTSNLVHAVILLIVKLIAFCVLTSPLVSYIDKKTNVIKHLVSIIRIKLKIIKKTDMK